MISNQPQLILFSTDSLSELLALPKSIETLFDQATFSQFAQKTCLQFSPNHTYKLAIIAKDFQDLTSLLEQAKKRISLDSETLISIPNKLHYTFNQTKPKIAFLFAGQGSQYLNMGKDLAETFALAKEIWTISDKIPWTSELKLQEVVFPSAAQNEKELESQELLLKQTEWAQPAIGAAALAQLELLNALGVKADFLGGHSYGEILALYVAGTITNLEEALDISRVRGEIMAAATEIEGAMIATMLDEPQALDHINKSGAKVFIANLNSQEQTVLSGARSEIEKIESYFNQTNIKVKRLEVSTAFHSKLVASSKNKLLQYIKSKNLQPPSAIVYSNITAKPYPQKISQIQSMIAEQLIKPVRFYEQIQNMYTDGARLFVELGPSTILSRLVDKCLEHKPHFTVSLDQKGQNGLVAFWNALGLLSVLGVKLNFLTIFPNSIEPIKKSEPLEMSQQNFLVQLHNKLSEVQKKFQKTLTEAYESYLKVTSSLLEQVAPYDKTSLANTGILTKKNESTRLNQEAISQLLFNIITEKTGYPLEMLASDMNLESDLGIDSLKRSEIVASFIGQLQTKFSISIEANAFKKVRLIQDAINRIIETNSIPANKSNTEMSQEDLVHNLFDVITEKTGYPLEMLSPDMNLESDLGIDSLKRTEIVAAFIEKLEQTKGLTLKLNQLKNATSIQDIVQRVNSSTNSTEPEEEKNKGNFSETRKSILEKHIPCLEKCAAIGVIAPFLIQKDQTIYLIPDNKGIAVALKKHLDRFGAKALLVAKAPANAEAVICLQGLDKCASITDTINLNKKVFSSILPFAQSLQDKEGTLILLQNTQLQYQKSFTFTGPKPFGIDALGKVASHEWNSQVKTIGIDIESLNTPTIASIIFNELLSGGPESEVYFDQHKQRYCPTTQPCPLTLESINQSFLKKHDTLIIVGGAYGITAQCLIELSKTNSLNFIILGRTNLDQPESKEIQACLDKSSLIKTTAAKEKLTPIELDKKVNAILKIRESKENLSKLEQNGSNVTYYSVDICNSSKVNKLVTSVRKKYKKIDGVIFAAGVIDDNLISKQNVHSFDRVFDTKVYGFKNLLDALTKDKLKLICCFSSIASQIGSIGQSNYAIANQVLNRLAVAEKEKRGKTCIVKSINWGPWDGGMIGPSLKNYFKENHIDLISLEEGCKAFISELAKPHGPVEIIVSHNVSSFTQLKKQYTWPVLLNNEATPLLQDHIIDTAVVPNALVLHWCLQLSKYLFPYSTQFMLSNLRMMKGIQIANYEQEGQPLIIHCEPQLTNAEKKLNFVLNSLTGQMYYKLSVTIDAKFNLQTIAKTALAHSHSNQWSFTAKDSYQQRKLFVGPSLQVLNSLEAVSKNGCIAKLNPVKNTKYVTDSSMLDVAFLDGGIQLSLLWRNQYSNEFALPTGVEALYVEKIQSIQFPVRCYLEAISMNDLSHKVNIVFVDNSEKIVGYMQGLSMHVINARTK